MPYLVDGCYSYLSRYCDSPSSCEATCTHEGFDKGVCFGTICCCQYNWNKSHNHIIYICVITQYQINNLIKKKRSNTLNKKHLPPKLLFSHLKHGELDSSGQAQYEIKKQEVERSGTCATQRQGKELCTQATLIVLVMSCFVIANVPFLK